MLNVTSHQRDANKITIRYYLTLVRMAIIKKSKIDVGEAAKKRESLYSIGENAN